MRGGYKILDLKGKNFPNDGTGLKIKGAYDAIENNYHKPILLENFSLDNIERAGRFLEFGVDNSNWVAFIVLSPTTSIEIIVTPDDMVSFTNY